MEDPLDKQTPARRMYSFLLWNKSVPPLPSDEERPQFPFRNTSFLSNLFFSWVLPILRVGYRRTLEPQDLFAIRRGSHLDVDVRAKTFLTKFTARKRKAEQKYLKKNGIPDTPHARRALITDPDFSYSSLLVLASLFETFKWEYTLSVLYKIGGDVAMGLNPLLLRALIAYVHQKASGVPVNNSGYGYSLGITGLVLGMGLCIAHYFHDSAFVGCEVKGLLTKVLLDKSFRLDRRSRTQFTPSAITSLLGTDLSRIDLAASFFAYIITFPIGVAITLVLLSIYMGGPAIGGVGFLILAACGIVYSTRPLMRLRRGINVHTDARVKAVKEVLNSMKIIKFYSWEPAYLKLVSAIRGREMSYMLHIQFLRNLVTALAISLPSVSSMIGFLSMYGYNGGSLRNAANVFSSLALFNILVGHIALMPLALSSTADAYVACKRVQAYLLSAEEVPDENYICVEKAAEAVRVVDASFSWDERLAPDACDKEAALAEKHAVSLRPSLGPLTFSLAHGEFVVVTGPIGSGKSSLLCALSGLMPRVTGCITVAGQLLLCAQPWIQNATVRNNIIFGCEPDKQLYAEIVRGCGLESDFEMLPAGDLTEIGERGVNLSGGQKARINLARAVYSVLSRNFNILLLDDVLSAVDAKVGRHIMDECILGLLRGRTRVLATHQLSLIQAADRIMFVNPDGSVDVDTPERLLAKNGHFSKLMEFQQEGTKQEKPELPDIVAEDEEDEELKLVQKQTTQREYEKDRGRLIEQEHREKDAIPMHIVVSYFRSGCGRLGITGMFPMIFASMACSTFCMLFQNVWLSFWSTQKFPGRSDGFYIGLYVMFALLYVVCTAWQFCSIVYVTNHASERLNIRALERVLRAPMSFFDTTPMGRILNRFTKDTDVLDNEISEQFRLILFGFSNMVGIYIMCIIYMPYFAVCVPFIFLAVSMLFSFYQASAREVKRIEGVQRSIVYANFDEVLQGNETIKLYNLTGKFVDKNITLINRMNESYFLANSLQRWLAVSLHGCAAGMNLLISMLCVGRAFKISAASSGLIISYLVSVSMQLINTSRSMGQLEQNLSSVERIGEYAIDLPQEAPAESSDPAKKPPPSWPEHGQIKFSHVSLRYRPNLPLVLQDLNLEIAAAEKIGICGRTGAGKSTIMTALYRLSEPEGAIEIDGVNILDIGLHELRSRLSIIPQDPVLFRGTIRLNLDPFSQLSDDVLYGALVKSGCILPDELPEVKQQTGPDLHKFHLNSVVEDNGANFSLGQRQMLALTRAIVRDCKVLILDEATSSVDYETDARVQATIVREFSHCTILCIAHRLKTIVNYDKILVMDKGRVAEFGTPMELYHARGIFRSMCDKSRIGGTEIEQAQAAKTA
ncbi:ABC-type multidrug transport system [Ogataea parapolymorpha DL-1]|uniref:ABC-type multidrug transport system n=1 Tax=Ogataea parapolymorpha (strain ATCC 26012 / BCRC 20466 / JCM 22074 / NRRL Y-7560 / DL-1) TaxID=871575 RepID=W1QJP7_OGAPD|nr:ABC-type multidrug transport system [Ogataea parapolymorpha DL-1]ESX02077.1 ABC-type multidrug transport system [Ogataea parapolymorpha DL-1]